MERVDGNRTVVLGLEDLSSAIELYPLKTTTDLSMNNCAGSIAGRRKWSGWGLSKSRPLGPKPSALPI